MPDISHQSSRPAMQVRLETLLSMGVGVSTVLDVGVETGTYYLMACLPAVTHVLFEPIDAFFPSIEGHYAAIQHQLLNVALSDQDGVSWQIGVSVDGTNRVTHSRLSDVPVTAADEANVIECKRIRKARLDTVMQEQEQPLAGPYLLKVDVDGHELPILAGAEETLRAVSILIVEAIPTSIRSKLEFAESHHFQLMDIVDPCYYHGVLSQVDLIFVNEAWVQKCPNLLPWQTKAFSWDAWHRFE